MARIRFLGGAREVGRSAVMFESKKGSKIILDYGVRFSEQDRLPCSTEIRGLRGIALSHCHIDHSGALPYLYKESDVPLFTNLQLAKRFVEAIYKNPVDELNVKSWDEYS